jgi:hypothetical protein
MTLNEKLLHNLIEMNQSIIKINKKSAYHINKIQILYKIFMKNKSTKNLNNQVVIINNSYKLYLILRNLEVQF